MGHRTLIAWILLMILQAKALAAGTLIPAPDRYDMVHDPIRDILYITDGAKVLRYEIWSDSFLSPFDLAGELVGIDLSADSRTLVVADLSKNSTQDWFHIIDLDTGSARKAYFQLRSGEAGTFSLAIGRNGDVLVASEYAGSGFLPLRLFNVLTGTSKELATISTFAMVASCADQTNMAFAVGDISDGPFGRYRESDGDLLLKQGYTDGTSWFNYEIGVNRDGTQYALPTYGGTFIYDGNLKKITTVGVYAGPQPIGVVYHPSQDIVYFAWVGTREVRAYETASFTEVASYDFEHNFVGTGNYPFTQGHLRISRDGSLLFATVNGGVRYVRLLPPRITSVSRDGKSLVIAGAHFDSRAVILIDGAPWKTIHDQDVPNTLFAKKLWKSINPGQTVRIQVSNPDAMVSEAFDFTRPAG